MAQANADGNPSNVTIIIPLNRYSFFEELERKMLIPMQIQFNITLNEDDEVSHKAHAVAASRIVIDRFELWLPKLIPNDSLYTKFVN